MTKKKKFVIHVNKNENKFSNLYVCKGIKNLRIFYSVNNELNSFTSNYVLNHIIIEFNVLYLEKIDFILIFHC